MCMAIYSDLRFLVIWLHALKVRSYMLACAQSHFPFVHCVLSSKCVHVMTYIVYNAYTYVFKV